jgi:hypothetical protein
VDNKWTTSKNCGDWKLSGNDDGTLPVDRIQVLILADIRRELQALNRTLNCPNFQAIPRKLDRISRNTAKPKKKRTAKNRGVKHG